MTSGFVAFRSAKEAAFAERKATIIERPILRHRGFTLVEMLITLAVLSVLTALGWPMVRNMLGSGEFRSAAKQVRVALIKARLQAIESAAPQRFRYRPGTGRFEVGPLATAIETERPRSRAKSRSGVSQDEPIEGTLPSGVTFQAADARSDRAASQPDDPSITVESERTDDADWSAPIVFFPNGQSSNARIRLAGPRGLWLEVTLRGLTGATRIGPLQRQEEER